MTDRERLIELKRQAINYAQEKADERGGLVCIDDEVEYLLANGVIVPPCKVGDMVYFYKAEIDEICPAKVIGIFNNYYTPSMPLWITIEYESKLIGKQEEKMASEVFKLLCHYTKEEAEAKLKERADNV